MARKSNRRTTTAKRKSYRRRRSSGLSGLLGVKKSAPQNDLKGEVLDIVLAAAGTFAAAKGVGMLDKMINKSDSKVMGMAAPAAVVAAGVAGAVILGDRLGKSLCKGVALGGAIKFAEKALGKDNLLAGLDDDDTPLMLPGVGDIGMANLPELSHYSENSNAPVTTTGGDPQYHMGTPSEMLNGDDEIIAH